MVEGVAGFGHVAVGSVFIHHRIAGIPEGGRFGIEPDNALGAQVQGLHHFGARGEEVVAGIAED